MLRQDRVILPQVPTRNLQHIPGDFGIPNRITLREDYKPDFQFFPFPKPKDNLPLSLYSLN